MRKVDFSAQQHTGADHVLSFFQRLRLDWLLRHFPPRLVRSVYVFVNGFVTIAVLALLALVSRNPFVSKVARSQGSKGTRAKLYPFFWPSVLLVEAFFRTSCSAS